MGYNMNNYCQHIQDAIYDILLEMRIIENGADIGGMPLLGKNGVMDSLTVMGFIESIERHFNVDIMDDINLDCMATTDTLIGFIQKNAPASLKIGSHLIIDCRRCHRDLLSDNETVRRLIHSVAEAIGAKLIRETYHMFSPAGCTGLAIVSASHIAVHTWPEYGYVGIDLFSCGDIGEYAVTEAIRHILGDVRLSCRILERKAD